MDDEKIELGYNNKNKINEPPQEHYKTKQQSNHSGKYNVKPRGVKSLTTFTTQDEEKLSHGRQIFLDAFMKLPKGKMEKEMKAFRKAYITKFQKRKGYLYGNMTRAMSINMFETFLRSMTPDEFRFKVLCLSSFYLGGLRSGEARLLNLRDVDLQNNKIMINSEKKDGAKDEQPLPDAWKFALDEYIQTYFKDIEYNDGYLFFNKTGQKGPLSQGWIERKFRQVCARQECQAVGLNKIYGQSNHPTNNGRRLFLFTFHSLRWTFCREALKRVNIVFVKSLMRHTSLDSTLHYSQPGRNELNPAANKVFSSAPEIKQQGSYDL